MWRDRLRARAAWIVLAIVDALKVAGNTLAADLPLSDSIPPDQALAHVEARQVDTWRNVRGLGRLVLAIGGPRMRVAGYLLETSAGPIFTPSIWWADKGAVAAVMGPTAVPALR